MKNVGQVVGDIAFGLSVYDLPDIDFLSLYEAGETAQTAAEEALAGADFPFEELRYMSSFDGRCILQFLKQLDAHVADDGDEAELSADARFGNGTGRFRHGFPGYGEHAAHIVSRREADRSWAAQSRGG